MPSLKQQALHGAFWSFAERFGQQAVQFVIAVILARILEPEDFGILGMLVVFIGMAQSVSDSGFGQALIQKQDADHTDESTVFWFNLAAGVCMAAALFLSAPWIAGFYDMPLLKPITQVYSLVLIVNSFGIVQNALLIKQLAFKRRVWAIMAGIVVSGTVGIALALMGFGVWALVVQGILMNAVQVAGYWVVHPWRPAFVFSTASFRSLWKFGSNMLFSGLLNSVFDNIYLVVIGRVYSAAELGFYQRGKRLMLLTSQSISTVVSQVNFPLLSRMRRGEAGVLGRVFGKVLKSTVLLVMPLMVGLAAVAPAFVHVLLGEKWMPCVPYLQLLCIGGVLYPIHVLNLDVLKALGRSDLFFRLEMIKKVLIATNIAITWRFGVIAMLWGQVVCSILCLIVNTRYAEQNLGMGLWKQFWMVRRILFASIVMAVVIMLVDGMLELPYAAVLPIEVATGMLVYLGVIVLLKERELFDTLFGSRRKAV
jgi:O-antigen/teichoic acid export membrane protein